MAKTTKNNKKESKDSGEEGKTSTEGVRRARKPVKRDFKEPIKTTQIDGKIYNKYGVKNVYELIGENDSKYLTHNVREYEALLNRMNTSDLQKHAVEVQVLPKEDRRLLIKLLIRQFEISHSRETNLAQQTISNPKPLSQEVLDIMAAGR